ncbi:hypothetical protein B0T19DRAFT_414117 [Cercophora scortea]|uniref:Nephrocystin 3-like N-terminal domain-containing protein n=1 Tax=Cercophora scortea TaxID=314031 RepID=A0AAE0IWK5_9PEZI|nr:hypothetical protein B0T19DRAFT_414117 [Cercophora scortea]
MNHTLAQIPARYPATKDSMEPRSPVLFRRKTLTNSAAEYVESRGIETLIPLADSPEDLKELQELSEFVAELDQFGPKGVVLDLAKYEESRKQMLMFRGTLNRFVILLKERKVDEQLGIVIKNPNDFTVEYVLEIIKKIGEGGQNNSKIQSCKNFVKRCYRKLEDNRGVIEGILTMFPDDIYGSVISGGFTLIMAAVEKHAEQREAIHNLLAEIPERLETIQRLSAIHHASLPLQSCADAVMFAIFSVLQSIVDDITRTWKVKFAETTAKLAEKLRGMHVPFRSKAGDQFSNALIKNSEHNAQAEGADDEGGNIPRPRLTVPNAIAELQKHIDRFQRQVDICSEERLGRGEISNGYMVRGLLYLMKQNTRMKTVMEDSVARLEKQFAGRAEETYQMAIISLQNSMYQLYASNPNFNAKTGGIDHEEIKLLEAEKEATFLRSCRENNARIASRWFKRLKGFTYDPETDMKDCLDHLELLEPDEKNVAQSILGEEQLNDWLREEESSILEIDLQTPPASINNPLSFFSSLFTTALQSTAQMPVLAFFCMHRTVESMDDDKSGPTGLVKSLNSQLIRFITDHRPTVDMSALADRDMCSKARKDIKDGLRLLDALLASLPGGDTVFIVIDSLSRLSGSVEAGDSVVKKLTRIVEKREEIVIKMMVTDALPGSHVRKVADKSLHVQDVVTGFGTIHVPESHDKITGKLRKRGRDDAKTGSTSGKTATADENEDGSENEDDDEEEDEDESDSDSDSGSGSGSDDDGDDDDNEDE